MCLNSIVLSILAAHVHIASVTSISYVNTLLNSGNSYVVATLVAISFQFPSHGGRGACFLGLILTVTACGSVIEQAVVALFSAVISMVLSS